jgi:hypothetical protein
MKLSGYFTKPIYYGTRLLLLIAIILFIIQGDWISVVNTSLILLLVLIPSILKNKYKFYFPFELDALISIFIFISLFLGSVQDYYERFPVLDTILHFKSGLLLGILGFILVYLLNDNKKMYLSPLFIAIFAVSFSMGLSVIWEIYEYTIDSLWGFNTQETGLPDTMGDLILNTIGALVVSVSGYFWMKKNKKIPFTPGDID